MVATTAPIVLYDEAVLVPRLLTAYTVASIKLPYDNRKGEAKNTLIGMVHFRFVLTVEEDPSQYVVSVCNEPKLSLN